ncbi:hypothetical protein AX17_005913 [Amanita inopinata Kibby_2008]|nr:hypothetical protein AX17_005913 [Amanita inopinata Kibby_2008]
MPTHPRKPQVRSKTLPAVPAEEHEVEPELPIMRSNTVGAVRRHHNHDHDDGGIRGQDDGEIEHSGKQHHRNDASNTNAAGDEHVAHNDDDLDARNVNHPMDTREPSMVADDSPTLRTQSQLRRTSTPAQHSARRDYYVYQPANPSAPHQLGKTHTRSKTLPAIPLPSGYTSGMPVTRSYSAEAATPHHQQRSLHDAFERQDKGTESETLQDQESSQGAVRPGLVAEEVGTSTGMLDDSIMTQSMADTHINLEGSSNQRRRHSTKDQRLPTGSQSQGASVVTHGATDTPFSSVRSHSRSNSSAPRTHHHRQDSGQRSADDDDDDDGHIGEPRVQLTSPGQQHGRLDERYSTRTSPSQGQQRVDDVHQTRHPDTPAKSPQFGVGTSSVATPTGIMSSHTNRTEGATASKGPIQGHARQPDLPRKETHITAVENSRRGLPAIPELPPKLETKRQNDVPADDSRGGGGGGGKSIGAKAEMGNTSTVTRYMNMLLALDEIPRIHNMAASFSTWILLAGFVLFPGTFSSLKNLGLNENGNNVSQQVAKGLLNAVSHVPLFVIAFICCGVGGVGMCYLWWRWRNNYLWLVNKIFLYVVLSPSSTGFTYSWLLSCSPGLLNSLAGIISTIANVYGVQHGQFSVTSKVTIIVTTVISFVCGTLTLWYTLWKIRRVKKKHDKAVGKEGVGKHGEGIVERIKRKANEQTMAVGMAV